VEFLLNLLLFFTIILFLLFNIIFMSGGLNSKLCSSHLLWPLGAVWDCGIPDLERLRLHTNPKWPHYGSAPGYGEREYVVAVCYSGQLCAFEA